MSHNLITTIHWHWFNNNTPRLVGLDLSYNQIAHVSGKLEVSLLSNIVSIDLSHNRISSFPEESFSLSTAKYDAHVDVTKNPYRCDKQLCWVWNEAQCLRRCLEGPCGSAFGTTYFKQCCYSCPTSFLYFGFLMTSEKSKCASPNHVEGWSLGRVMDDVCNETNDATPSEHSSAGQPVTTTTATLVELMTTYKPKPVVLFASSSSGTLVTSDGPTAPYTLKTKLEVERDGSKTVVAVACGTVVLTLIVLSTFTVYMRIRRR
uniref:Uncharacterized protein n=1 Tax=Branchiostoma floridae TaxID=7739 RepID=C3Z960_BRAFL|eukprot:XP_002594961.1 hypothetical protein BRAFLDRAFT_103706 [Branchiostoma floridae]